MRHILKTAVLGIFLSSCLAGAQTYRVANLGMLGEPWSSPGAINDQGHVAGTSRLASGVSQAFFWSSATKMVDLSSSITDTSGAFGINSSDQVVGGDTNTQHAFFWSNSGLQDIGTLGGCCSDAFAINEGSVVVGWSEAADGTDLAFSWAQVGGMQALSTRNGQFNNTVAYAINREGYIVGVGDLAPPTFTVHALLWAPNGGITDIGALAIGDSVALGINSANQVVGWFTVASGDTHPFIWSRTAGMVDLGVLSGYSYCVATAINNQGQVVGTCFPNGRAVPHAFVWTSSTGMQDLNNLVSVPYAGTLGEALAINNRGQIAVWSAPDAGFKPSRALRLTPQ